MSIFPTNLGLDLYQQLLCGYYTTGNERRFSGLLLFYVSSNNGIGSEVSCGRIALTDMLHSLLSFFGRCKGFPLLGIGGVVVQICTFFTSALDGG
jgi:hypothetical protein